MINYVIIPHRVSTLFKRPPTCCLSCVMSSIKIVDEIFRHRQHHHHHHYHHHHHHYHHHHHHHHHYQWWWWKNPENVQTQIDLSRRILNRFQKFRYFWTGNYPLSSVGCRNYRFLIMRKQSHRVDEVGRKSPLLLVEKIHPKSKFWISDLELFFWALCKRSAYPPESGGDGVRSRKGGGALRAFGG